jgi:hypothetical protein
MILVDRLLPLTYLFLTLDGRTFIHRLYVKHDATREEYALIMPGDISDFKDRYNEFPLNTSAFSNMPDGYYTYEIREVGTGETIEQGKLYIKPATSQDTPSADTPNDEIIIVN